MMTGKTWTKIILLSIIPATLLGGGLAIGTLYLLYPETLEGTYFQTDTTPAELVPAEAPVPVT